MATVIEYWQEQGTLYDGKVGTIRKNGLLRVVFQFTSIPYDPDGYFTKTATRRFSFNCSAKALPSISERPTWTVNNDDTGPMEGVTYAGRPEKFEPIELTTRTPVGGTLTWLQRVLYLGVHGALIFTYTDALQDLLATITMHDCVLTGITHSGGELSAISTTTLRFQPSGIYQPEVETSSLTGSNKTTWKAYTGIEVPNLDAEIK